VTIRRKLVVWVSVLFAAVLVVGGTASVFILGNQLIGGIDSVLTERASFFAEIAGTADVGIDISPVGRPEGDAFPAASDMAVIVADSTGNVLFAVPSGRADDPDPLPDISQLELDSAESKSGAIEVIDAVDDQGPSYRALATPIRGGEIFFVLAISLDNAQETIETTTLILAVAGTLAIVVLAALVWWAVRKGLRPIDDMIDAAAHIGAGDLSHRVPAAAPNTEVGQLAVALNSMLTQIETAASAKTESEERMRRFLSDASHELRTPLTSIRGYAELQRHGATSPEETEQALKRIEHEAVRMSRLVDDLLLLARLDQRRPLAADPVDLATLILEAIDDAKAVEPDRAIEFDSDKASAVVLGDRDRLRQVMDNLLANVRLHTPRDARIDIYLTHSQDTITIVVADDGPGMSHESSRRAFERFYRGDPDAPGGSGLGLSIVQAIIAAHGGATGISSQPAGGTIVTLNLPVTGTTAPRDTHGVPS